MFLTRLLMVVAPMALITATATSMAKMRTSREAILPALDVMRRVAKEERQLVGQRPCCCCEVVLESVLVELQTDSKRQP